MSFRIAIWLFFCFTINICSACECDNPPFYFMQNLKYDHICHIKILKHYPAINSRNGGFEGLTKVVVLNGRNSDQILDTLLFINTCPSLICGLRLDHFPIGKELLIKAIGQGIFDDSEFRCNIEIVTNKAFNTYCVNGLEPLEYIYRYNFITSHSCDNVILEVENENVKGIIASKYQSSKFKFYKFISFFSKKWAESFAIKTKTSRYEQQSVNTFEIFRKLKFISNNK